MKYLNNVVEADRGKLKLLIRSVRGFKVSDAGGAPGFQVDAGLKFQGSSSSMRLLGCPTAIASRVALSQA